MHLRLGRLVGPPLSEALTKFDHKKLDAIVQSRHQKANHREQQTKWRQGFVREFLVDEVARINANVEGLDDQDDTLGNNSSLDLSLEAVGGPTGSAADIATRRAHRTQAVNSKLDSMKMASKLASPLPGGSSRRKGMSALEWSAERVRP